MSGIHLVPADSDLRGAQISFSDLIKHLEKDLEQARILPDLECLIGHLGDFLRKPDFDSDQKAALKRLRQRGYDIRRSMRKSEPLVRSEKPKAKAIRSDPQKLGFDSDHPERSKSDPSTDLVQKPSLGSENPTNAPTDKTKFEEEPPVPTSTTSTTAPTSRTSVHRIILKTLPPVGLALSASLVGTLLWLQSVDLYLASGFSSAGLVAVGGIVMMVGFAAFYAFYPSKMALLWCLYASGYEAYFVISGTVSEEISTKETIVKEDSQLDWLKEQALRAKVEYERQKSRYENPSSKEYQSGWFKKVHVDPKWTEYSKAQEALRKASLAANDQISFDHAGWLKIFYRLGLVILLMLLVHSLSHFCRLRFTLTT